MPDYKGRFQLTRSGTVAAEGPCRLEFDQENFTLVPAGGASLSVDLADFDWLRAADLEIRGGLYTGEELLLTHLGKLFTECSEKLRSAWTERLVRALLLSDLPLLDTFRGGFRRLDGAGQDPQPCEIRVYETGLAVLPEQSPPFHLRLSDVVSEQFDASIWEVRLTTRRGNLAFGRLAKRSDLFHQTLGRALGNLRALSSKALRDLFPFLTPAAFQKLDAAWQEGTVISRGALEAIDPRLWLAFLNRAVDRNHQPYAEHLVALSEAALIHVSFKRVRPEREADAAEEAEASGEEGPALEPGGAAADGAGQQEAEGEQFIYSFFFPISEGGAPRNLVAQEVTSAGGRATYWFRLLEQAEYARSTARAAREGLPASLEQLNSALALLNFRREPIYLSEADIYAHPRRRPYAIALRRIPELRAVRQRFLARSIHSSLDAWKKQVDAVLARGDL